jgi:hypothetical protein
MGLQVQAAPMCCFELFNSSCAKSHAEPNCYTLQTDSDTSSQPILSYKHHCKFYPKHSYYQLARFTPGKFPAIASILKLNCRHVSSRSGARCAASVLPWSYSYSSHLEIAQNTTSLTSHDASIANLRGTGIRVHLRELQLSFGADSRSQGSVSDDVAECLSVTN